MSTPASSDRPPEPAWVRVVNEKIKAIRLGFIVIKVHDGQVVLVEATEQTKFDLNPKT
jgi:hypothetical protein